MRHCRALIAVHDGGGIGAAARLLGMAQSTVSETLLSLERLIDTPVTQRRPGREAILTPAGDALLPHARSLVATADAALAALAAKAQEVIRLGTVESASSFLLPEPLAAFRRDRPDVDLRITVGLCADLKKAVSRAEIDAALTVEPCREDRATDGSAELSRAQLVLVAAPHHPLAARAPMRRELDDQRYLLTEFDGAFQELMANWIGHDAAALKLDSAGSVDGVKRGVRDGTAIGVLPDYAVADELSDGTLVAVAIDAPPPVVSLRLTMAGSVARSPALAILVDKLARF